MSLITTIQMSSLQALGRAVFSFVALSMCVLATSWPVSALADEYSAGMKAYMVGDYELAKTLWMEGAETKDAKSMFNLGFLHEQNLVKGASFNRAEKWYRLAAKNGYPAADYHLAQLLASKAGKQRQSRELVQKAAANGYSPARSKLGQAPIQRVVPTSSISSPIDNLANTRYQNQQWIASQDKSNWTIQMLAFDNLKKVQEYIDQHSLHDKAAYFTELTAQGLLYKLVYGSFSNKRAADIARQQLPRELKTNGPWLRSIASIQKIISN